MNSIESIMGTGIALLEDTLDPISPMKPNITFISIWVSMVSYCLKQSKIDFASLKSSIQSIIIFYKLNMFLKI